MNRPHARKRLRRVQPAKKSSNWVKYLYLLSCVTCVTAGWTGAKYIASIEGVVQEGRGADYSFTITNKVGPEEDAVVNYFLEKGADPREKGDKLLEYSATDPVTNQFYLKSKVPERTVTYTVTYTSEVMLRFYIYSYHTANVGEKQKAKVKSIEYLGDDVVHKAPNPQSSPDNPVITDAITDKIIIIDDPKSDLKDNAILPATKTSKTFQCKVTLDFGDLTEEADHYISIVPTIVQVD